MTEGTSQGLFIVVAIVIFGIFVGLSYTLFGSEGLSNDLENLFTDASKNPDFDKNADYNVGDVVPNEESDFIFDNVDTIIGYKGKSPEVIIPNTIDGKKVTTISGDAFNDKGITKLIMPNSLTTIEDGSVSTVTASIPFDNKLVSEEAPKAGLANFIENNSLIMTVSAAENTENNKKVIGAFANNTIKEISFSANLEYIGSFAFFSGTLDDVILPEGLEVIEEGSFEENLLEEIKIPSTVVKIGDNAFKDNELKDVTYGKGSNLTDIGRDVFSGNKIDSITIPKGTTVIPSNSYNNAGLESVTIPEGTKVIGDNAFSNNNLTKVTIPNGVTKIGKDSFSKNKLKEVSIPDSVVEVDDGAFKENELTNVDLPAGLQRIGDYAFYKNLLPVINLPESLLDIGTYAFYKNELVDVKIPSKLGVIKEWTFAYNKMTKKPTIPTNIKTEESFAFYGNLFDEKVVFKDSNLEKALASTLGVSTGNVTQSKLATIKTLDLTGKNVTSLLGLESAINLESLTVTNSLITDISSVSNLTKLKTLNLAENRLTSSTIRNLTKMTSLTKLDVSWNGLSESDVKFLNALPIANKTTIQKYVIPTGSSYTNGLTDSNVASVSGAAIKNLFFDNNLTTGNTFSIYYADPNQIFTITLNKPHDIYRYYADSSGSRYGNMGLVKFINSKGTIVKSFYDRDLHGYINVNFQDITKIVIDVDGGDGSWRLNEFEIFGNPTR